MGKDRYLVVYILDIILLGDLQNNKFSEVLYQVIVIFFRFKVVIEYENYCIYCI